LCKLVKDIVAAAAMQRPFQHIDTSAALRGGGAGTGEGDYAENAYQKCVMVARA